MYVDFRNLSYFDDEITYERIYITKKILVDDLNDCH